LAKNTFDRRLSGIPDCHGPPIWSKRILKRIDPQGVRNQAVELLCGDVAFQRLPARPIRFSNRSSSDYATSAR
jgi:hypothetical protein